jgi:asparaginyl-tRNA synthetase
VTGTFVESQGKGQDIELLVDNPEKHKFEILGENLDYDNYPLSAKNCSVEHLRKYLHLRPKSNFISAMARVRNACAFATH